MNKKTPLYLCVGYIIGFMIAKEVLQSGNAQLNAYFVLGAVVGTWTYHFVLGYKKRLIELKKEEEE